MGVALHDRPEHCDTCRLLSTDPASRAQRCRICHGSLDSTRYTADTHVGCALEENEQLSAAWREQKREAAYARLRAAGILKDEKGGDL